MISKYKIIIFIKIYKIFFFKIINIFLLIKLKLFSKFEKKISIEIIGISRSGSSLLEYLLSESLNSLCLGEIHYHYFNLHKKNFKYKLNYRSLETKKFYNKLKLPKQDFLKYLLNFSKKKIIISSSKNHEYLKIRGNEKNINKVNIIIIKEPLLQLKSYCKSEDSFLKVDETLYRIFNRYIGIFNSSVKYNIPFILIKYEDLFNKNKFNFFIRKILFYTNNLKTNYKSKKKFYFPINGSNSFHKSRDIKIRLKNEVVFDNKLIIKIKKSVNYKSIKKIYNFF